MSTPLVSHSEPQAQAELTVRALVVGCLVGSLIAVMNVYMGLKTGFNDSGNITASLLGFALLRAWPRRSASLLETNMVQTAATSAGAMCFGTCVIGMVPALRMSGYTTPAWGLVVWGTALAVIGIVVAGWLRPQFLQDERLPFPTGIATAEVIRIIHASGSAAASRLKSLAGAFGVAALVTWFRDGKPNWLPQAVMLPGRIAGTNAAALSLGLSVSPMLAGVGALVGLHLGASVLLGATIAWAAITPVVVAKHIVSSPDYPSMIGWLLWPAVGLMLASAVTQLALDARHFREVILRRAAASVNDWIIVGVAAVVAVGAGWFALRISPVWSLFALVCAVFLANVATRAAGETDVNPVGTMGQLTQFAVGGMTRDATANLGAAGIVVAVGNPLTTAIWSYKAGELLGADVRKQRVALFAGAACGALAAVAAYSVVVASSALGSGALPAPGALALKAVADGVSKGAAAFPPYAATATVIAVLIGVAFTLLARARSLRFLPSPMAMGIGLLVPATFSSAIFVGALAAALFRWKRPRSAEALLQPLAAGAIAGEAITGVLVATLQATHVL